LVASEYINPPIPLPAAAILFANDLFLRNHCGTIPTLATNKNPIPNPNASPCDRNKCQILVAHEAPRSPAVWNRMPTPKVGLVPNLLTNMVASGDIRSAIEIEKPPTNANSRDVAPGNVLLER